MHYGPLKLNTERRKTLSQGALNGSSTVYNTLDGAKYSDLEEIKINVFKDLNKTHISCVKCN
jgi:hypothetical protein